MESDPDTPSIGPKKRETQRTSTRGHSKPIVERITPMRYKRPGSSSSAPEQTSKQTASESTPLHKKIPTQASEHTDSAEHNRIITPLSTTPTHGDTEDASAVIKVRGRGTSLVPTNRFETIRLTQLAEHVCEVMAEHENGRQVKTLVYADSTRTLINPVDSPDLSFSWTVNPYRGCEHGCIYCYARPGHEYLSLSSGLDFETKIFAKYDAPRLLRRELMRSSWKGDGIVLSGVTDPYQPIERNLNITRELLKVCIEFRQPVSIITKNRLILRDIDLLSSLHKHRAIRCAVSLTSLDATLASRMEPRASSPAARLEIIRELSKLGIPVTVMTAPIIPGINDGEIPTLLRAAAEAGATRAGYVLLRLPYQIKELFITWLHEHFPLRAAKVEALLRDTREGMLYQGEFFQRGRGTGPISKHIHDTFSLFARRFGLISPRMVAMNPTPSSPFRRPPGPQGMLFESE